MIEIKENGCVSARDLHAVLEIKKRYSVWFEIACRNADIKIQKERCISKYTSNNQKLEDYDFQEKEALFVVMMSQSKNSLN